VVVDDGSRDSTPEVLARYAQGSPLIEIVRHEANMGPSAAKNHGLDRLMGRVEAVALLDSDDWLREGVLEEMFRCLAEDETISQVLGYMASEDGTRQGGFSRGSGSFTFEEAVCGDPDGDFFRLARSASLGDIRFNERSWGGEGALWARLLKLGDGLVLDRTVAICERKRHDRISDRLNLPSLDDRLVVGRVWAGRALLDVAGDSMRVRCPGRHYAVVSETARWALHSGDRSSCRFLAQELHRSKHPLQAAGLRTAALLPLRAQRALLVCRVTARRYWYVVRRRFAVKARHPTV
jgi:glycosyltransferase involved in cell wall biosynthesis